MSNPEPYVQSYNFSGYQSANPNSPLPGTQVDIQFAALEEATAEIVDALADIRRSDGALKNGSVGPDQLSAALSLGFTNTGLWAEDVVYSTGDGVVLDETFYSARTSHTSSALTSPDISPETWQFLFTFASVTTPDGSITPAKLSADAAGFRTKIGLGTLSVQDVAYLDSSTHALTQKTTPASDDEFRLTDSAALFVGKRMKWSAIITAMQAAIGQGKYIGELVHLSGITLPALCVWANGQAISRTTYAAYFAEVSTAYGVGNGSTTFNVPDFRGRVAAGKDDMGGSAAGRLTGLSGGVSGVSFGGVGGSEAHTLTTPQLSAHNHVATFTGDALAPHDHDVSADGTRYGSNPQNPAGAFYTSSGDSNPAYTTPAQPTSGDSAGTPSGVVAVAITGENVAHNNVQPTGICNIAIFVGV